jgi:hypothetical protein
MAGTLRIVGIHQHDAHTTVLHHARLCRGVGRAAKHAQASG